MTLYIYRGKDFIRDDKYVPLSDRVLRGWVDSSIVTDTEPDVKDFQIISLEDLYTLYKYTPLKLDIRGGDTLLSMLGWMSPHDVHGNNESLKSELVYFYLNKKDMEKAHSVLTKKSSNTALFFIAEALDKGLVGHLNLMAKCDWVMPTAFLAAYRMGLQLVSVNSVNTEKLTTAFRLIKESCVEHGGNLFNSVVNLCREFRSSPLVSDETVMVLESLSNEILDVDSVLGPYAGKGVPGGYSYEPSDHFILDEHNRSHLHFIIES